MQTATLKTFSYQELLQLRITSDMLTSLAIQEYKSLHNDRNRSELIACLQDMIRLDMEIDRRERADLAFTDTELALQILSVPFTRRDGQIYI